MPGVVHRQNVWMAQSCCRFDFLQEPIPAERLGQLGSHDLDRHLATVLPVGCKEHDSHATLTELLLNLVELGECGLYARKEFGHLELLSDSPIKMLWFPPHGQGPPDACPAKGEASASSKLTVLSAPQLVQGCEPNDVGPHQQPPHVPGRLGVGML